MHTETVHCHFKIISSAEEQFLLILRAVTPWQLHIFQICSFVHGRIHHPSSHQCTFTEVKGRHYSLQGD